MGRDSILHLVAARGLTPGLVGVTPGLAGVTPGLAGEVAGQAVGAVDRACERRVARGEGDREGLVLARAEVRAGDSEQAAGGRVAGERPVGGAGTRLGEGAAGDEYAAARGADGPGVAAVRAW